MKKFLLPIFASLLLLAGCDFTEHVSFENIELDYPAHWILSNHDTDEDTMTLTIDKPDDEIGYIFVEVFHDSSAVEEGDDLDMVGAYLSHTAHRVAEIFLPDEDITFTKGLPEEEDFYYDVNDDPVEAGAFVEGTYKGRTFFAGVRSVMIDTYRITAYVQADSEFTLDEYFDKVYATAHLKEAE